MYNVFTDFHHASLLNSLIMLFEGRLGGKVYRPIGVEWHEKGFWKVYDHPATAAQFLGINGATLDGTPPLNETSGMISSEDGPAYWLCHDIDSGQYNKAITYDEFLRANIDIIIASLPQHIEPFRKLCELHPNHPKLIYQIGNAWNIPPGLRVRNVMASAIIHEPIPPDVHFISYHQEFDTKIFYPKPDYTNMPGQNISSFVNCFSIDGLFTRDWELFQKVESLMSVWNFRCYGGQCRDGSKGPTSVLADAMREAAFIWHTKFGGDGYGHIIHNSAAIGRPMITKIGYYMGKMGMSLMKDGETCIAIDGLEPEAIVNKILYYYEPKRYAQLCENVVNNFKSVVHFDVESLALQNFLRELI